MLKITLVRSTIGAIPKHRRTIEALGLRKRGRSVYKQDSDALINRSDVCETYSVFPFHDSFSPSV